MIVSPPYELCGTPAECAARGRFVHTSACSNSDIRSFIHSACSTSVVQHRLFIHRFAHTFGLFKFGFVHTVNEK